MSEPIISFIPENDEKIRKLFDDAKKGVSDLRIPFGLIANNWYKGNRKIFSLKGPGLYPILGGLKPKELIMYKGARTTRNEVAEVLKAEEVNFIYPLLKRSGKLADSLTSKNDGQAVNFVGRQELVLGTKVPYGIYHQSDKARKKIPQRKFVFIDGGDKEVSKDAIIAGRVENWTNIIADYVAQVLSGDAS